MRQGTPGGATLSYTVKSDDLCFGQEASKATRRRQETQGGATLSYTVKSDDLCEQLAIFWLGSEQSHQEAPGDAKRSDAFVHC